jgi:membrane associated rhomboid family serine protease
MLDNHHFRLRPTNFETVSDVAAGAKPARMTYAIAIATVVAFIVARIIWPADYVSEQAGFIPLRFMSTATGFVVPEWLTPLTATLAHGDWVHIGFNMLMLVYCGRSVETVLGPWPLAVLYLVGAYIAAAGQYVVGPLSPVPMIGASGAISAVLAVYALLFGRNDVKRWGPIPAHWVRAIWLAIAWTGLQWLVGLASTRGGGYQVATAAHVGGFLAGLALARPLLAWRYRGA